MDSGIRALSSIFPDADYNIGGKKIESLGAPDSGDDAKRHDSAPATHGAEKHTNVTRELFLPACEGYALAGTPTSYGGWPVVEGAADANEPRVYLGMKVPDDFVSFTKVEAIWLSPAASGDMMWKLGAMYFASGEAYNTHEDTPGVGATATGGAGVGNVQEPNLPLTLTDLAKGDYLGLLFHRYGSLAQDTLDDVVRLYGLLFTYTAEQ